MTKKQTSKKSIQQTHAMPNGLTTADPGSQTKSIVFLSRFSASAIVGIFIFMILAKCYNSIPLVIDGLLATLIAATLLFSYKLKLPAQKARKGKRNTITFSYIRFIAFTLLGAAIFVYNFWFIKSVPIILMPLVLALVMRLLTPKLNLVRSIALNCISVLFGFLFAASIFNIDSFQAFAKTWATTNPDTFFAVFQNAIVSMPLFSPSENTTQLPLIAFVMICLAGGFGALLVTLEKNRESLKQWLPHVLIIIIAINFLAVSITNSGPLTKQLAINPEPESYAYDAFIYLKTYYNLASGESYYHALPDAVRGDKRISDPTKEWLSGYITFRLPTVFYLWRIFAGGNGANIYYLSLLLSLIALVLLFFGVNKTSGAGAAGLGALLVAPYLCFGANWVNILFPDWWAALFAIIGVALFMYKRYIWSAAIIVLAALSREPMGILIAAGLIAGIMSKERKVWLPFGVSLVSFIALFAIHQYLVRKNIVLTNGNGLSTFLVGLNLNSLTGISNYLAYPLTFIGISTILPCAAFVAAFYQKDRIQRYFMAAFMVGFIFYLVMARASSYQGQMVLPLILASLPFMLRPYINPEETTP